MKIEKVNDHQIRCTLTREDLASRCLKLSELAYGSDKAKDLFRDMMEKANFEYGFEAENIPLMIEAIPISGECIVLVITKVEDPEEFDTRFSKFAPGIADDSDADAEESSDEIPISDSSDESSLKSVLSEFISSAAKKDKKSPYDVMVYSYDSFTALAKVCKAVSSFYIGSSSVYRDEKNDTYVISLSRESMDKVDFIRSCNIFSEYGKAFRGVSITENYMEEHYERIVVDDAIDVLAQIG